MKNALTALAILTAATIHLDTRPARGPGSIDASPHLQALTLGVCAAWAVIAWLLTHRILHASVTAADVAAVATFAVALARLARPWSPTVRREPA